MRLAMKNGIEYKRENDNETANAYMAQTIIRRWGNSHGIRLSKEVLAQMGLKEDDTLGINICDGKMIIEKINRRRYSNLTERLEAFYNKPIDEIYVERYAGG